MPWINGEMCTGCGICVKKCPADAIVMQAEKIAEIDMNECIRCGDCHDICPQEAVRHDSEKIKGKMEMNKTTARCLLEKCETKQEKMTYLDKYIRSLNIENKANQDLIENLEIMKKEL
jgi:ferredoxin